VFSPLHFITLSSPTPHLCLHLPYCTQLSPVRFSIPNIFVTQVSNPPPFNTNALSTLHRCHTPGSSHITPLHSTSLHSTSLNFTCSLYKPHDCTLNPTHKHCYRSGRTFPTTFYVPHISCPRVLVQHTTIQHINHPFLYTDV
jgi:hypothetical protein